MAITHLLFAYALALLVSVAVVWARQDDSYTQEQELEVTTNDNGIGTDYVNFEDKLLPLSGIDRASCSQWRRCRQKGGTCMAQGTCPGKSTSGCSRRRKCSCCLPTSPVPVRNEWWRLANIDIENTLNMRQNNKVAQNVILFIGDGMGITASTAGRIFKGQLSRPRRNGEEGYLTWEQFPNSGLLKTYSANKQVTDSAAGATALLCGIKANSYTLGVTPDVIYKDCSASLKSENQVDSILKWAQDAGKHTGIVTTTRVTHATPAAAYAHSASRNWEDDEDLGSSGRGCKDIADQLVNGETGKNIRVILGGGSGDLGAYKSDRDDGRDLTKEWLREKSKKGSAKYVTTVRDLKSVDTKKTDYLLGLFSDTHISYDMERNQDEPSLKDMTLTAIKMLSKNKDGFFLLVEGGRIDHGLHANKARRALEEIVAFDQAIDAALKELNLEETLVVVTADHSHVMTMNGYSRRGNNILGIADGEADDDRPYTTLMFTNGPGFDYDAVKKDGKYEVVRDDPASGGKQYHDREFEYLAAVPLDTETHGGEDVAVYATGPMSHLFHHVHEQNYVAHVMALAACVGPRKGDKCKRPENNDNINSDNLRSGSTFSKPLQQYLSHQQQQLISTLGSELVPRTATGIENENHVD